LIQRNTKFENRFSGVRDEIPGRLARSGPGIVWLIWQALERGIVGFVIGFRRGGGGGIGLLFVLLSPATGTSAALLGRCGRYQQPETTSDSNQSFDDVCHALNSRYAHRGLCSKRRSSAPSLGTGVKKSGSGQTHLASDYHKIMVEPERLDRATLTKRQQTPTNKRAKQFIVADAIIFEPVSADDFPANRENYQGFSLAPRLGAYRVS
jgi:hypothetical protein